MNNFFITLACIFITKIVIAQGAPVPTINNGFLICPNGKYPQRDFTSTKLNNFDDLKMNIVGSQELLAAGIVTMTPQDQFRTFPGFISKTVPSKIYIMKIKAEYEDKLDSIFFSIAPKVESEIQEHSYLFSTNMSISNNSGSKSNIYKVSNSKENVKFYIFFLNDIQTLYFLENEGDPIMGMSGLLSDAARSKIKDNRKPVSVDSHYASLNCVGNEMHFNQGVFFKKQNQGDNSAPLEMNFILIKTKFRLTPN
jgi:hypothetical protein